MGQSCSAGSCSTPDSLRNPSRVHLAGCGFRPLYAFCIGAKPKGGFDVHDPSISNDNILAVSNQNGETTIGPVDPAGRSAIRENLFTAGELLRRSQLTPDLDAVQKTPENQLELFGKHAG